MGIWIGATTSAMAVAIGTFLMTRRDREARSFALVAYAASAYVASLTALFATRDMLFSDLVVATGALALAAALAFALTFMRQPKARYFLALLPMIVVMVLSPTQAFIAGVRLHETTGAMIPVHGPLMPLLAVVVLAYCIVIWKLLHGSVYRAAGIRRVQARIVLAAFVTLFSCVLVCNVIGPLVGFSAANMVTVIGLIAFLACVTYALSVKRLFDVQLLLYRGLTHAIAPLSVLAGVGGILGALGVIDPGASRESWALAATAGAIMGTGFAHVILPSGSDYIRRLVYPGLMSEARMGELVSDALAPLATTSELAAVVRSLLVNLFHPERIERVGKATSSSVERSLVRLEIAVSGLGRYVLVGRRTGEPYTDVDERLARRLLAALDIAVRHAKERDEEVRGNELAARRLVADIAHGLQTPLAVLKAEFEGDVSVSAELRARIARAADDLSDRLRGLITYARGEMRAYAEEAETIRLDEHVRELAEYVEIMAHEMGVGIRFGRMDEASLLAKRDEVATLVTNLLSNAVEYARRGSALHEVFISVRKDDDATSLSIADTGPGMTEEERERAFEPLFRGSAAVSGSGMGLGLAIARQIAQAHQATIELRERPEGGTVATVSFRDAA